mgnify:FL=1
MNIMDSCPERRNFTLICLVTITYFWADGSIKNDNITIPFVNIVLHNTAHALHIYLLIFAWFTFRYWLVFKSEPYSRNPNSEGKAKQTNWKAAFVSAMNNASPPPAWLVRLPETSKLRVETEIKAREQRRPNFTFEDKRLTCELSKLTLNLVFPLQSSFSQRLELKGMKKWLLIVSMLIRSFWKDPFIPTWYIPWILFVMSVSFLAWNFITN